MLAAALAGPCWLQRWQAHVGCSAGRPMLAAALASAAATTAGRTMLKSGGGFPRQKLDSVHVALRSIPILALSFNCSSSGGSELKPSTKSRQRGESPAMLPSAHTA
eukprot:356110-Chlamydomonas_euryale.AAC.5